MMIVWGLGLLIVSGLAFFQQGARMFVIVMISLILVAVGTVFISDAEVGLEIIDDSEEMSIRQDSELRSTFFSYHSSRSHFGGGGK